jgi:hypothetical protein
MGLFTTTEDPDLEDARKQVVASDRVCPHCQAPFQATGATLSAWNAALGIEGHTCPACGQVMSIRRPSAHGL